MMTRPACTVCAGRDVSPLLRIDHLPVLSNELCDTRSGALSVPAAAISLGFCHACGHVFNVEFDSQLVHYGSSYESSLQCSGRFREYENGLLDSLIDRYQLHGRTIVEIGCGSGDFLKALCRRGGNRGFGFDPAYRPDACIADPESEVSISGEKYGPGHQLRGEFVYSRQTLEHIGNPREFLANIHDAIGRGGVPVFFEVPNALYTLRDGGIWDIIYEHCSYFNSTSLARVFSDSGYLARDVAEVYNGQFLTIHAETEAGPQTPAAPASAELCSLVESFAGNYHRKMADWRLRLQKLSEDRRKVVIWGAGAKGTSFLNVLRPPGIDYVVDVNPRKQGNYVPGTGQQIVAPQSLAEYRPDVVIVMNAIYRNEIVRTTVELGLEPEFLYA